MYPILFKIGSITFYSHGVLIVLGLLAGGLLSYFLAKKNGLATEKVADNIIYISIFGIIGARIAYLVLYPSQYSSITQIFLLWNGGLVSYGGFFLGGFALMAILRFQKQPILRWFDVFSTGLFMGMAVGRVGDLLAADYGSFSDGHFWTANPLLEAVLCIIIVIISSSAFIALGSRLRDGLVFILSLLIYTGGRFIIEFQRGDPILLMGLSLSQLFSIFIFILSLVSLTFLLKAKEKGNYGIIS